MFHQSVLIITLICSWSAQAIEGPSCSVEVCGSPQRCSSGQTCSLCQGHTIVCTCFVDGRPLGWTNDRFGVQPGGINFINPVDSATSSDSATGAVAQVTDVGRNGATIVNISSTLTLNVTSDQFNGTRIGCYDDTGPMNAQTVTLELRDPPLLPPDRPTVQFNNPGQSFTISWNNITSPFTGYNVTVSPSNPCTQSPDVSCNTAYVCSGWSASGQPNVFEFSVNAVCGSVVGSESAGTSVNLQAPNPPQLTTIPLYNSSGNLLEIQSQAREGSSVNITDGVDGSPIEYIFSYNGSPIPLSTGSTPQCTSSSCQHTFRVTSSQVQQYTVSVAARNVVGMGTASAPVTVDTTNTVFNVTVDVRVQEVTCQFLNGPVASATCTIQYGTDETNLNLTNTNSSTNVNSVTVMLSEPLQPDTRYYYVVSSMGVRMQGTFRTECAAEDLGDTVDTITDSRCQSQQSVQIGNGRACYNGLQTGSEAVYSCNCGFSLQGDQTRVCQQNGLWSGMTPVCRANCSEIPPPDPSLVAGGQLTRNTCTVLEYSCRAGPVSVITLQYNCSREQWSPTDMCNVPGPPTVTIVVVVVVCVILIILVVVDIIDLCCMKYKGVSTVGQIILIITVVGIPFAIAIYCWTKKKVSLNFSSSGKRDEDVELREPSPDKTSPPAEATDSAPAPLLYADPNTIPREEHPATGDVYTMPDKARKTHKPETTYQDPGAISHEAAPTGELYTVPDKKKGAKKKKQPQASRPTEEELAGMYSMPDKTRKQQSQGLNYADVGFHAPSSGKVPEKAPQVFYADVKNV